MEHKHAERFMSKVAFDPGGCWLWRGYIDSERYGAFTIGYRSLRAHRAAYEHFVGPIHEGLVIDHLCRVRHCVNPAHMEPVTSQENTRRKQVLSGWFRRSDPNICLNGHDVRLSGFRERKTGHRTCIQCERDRKQRRRERRLAS